MLTHYMRDSVCSLMSFEIIPITLLCWRAIRIRFRFVYKRSFTCFQWQFVNSENMLCSFLRNRNSFLFPCSTASFISFPHVYYSVFSDFFPTEIVKKINKINVYRIVCHVRVARYLLDSSIRLKRKNDRKRMVSLWLRRCNISFGYSQYE